MKEKQYKRIAIVVILILKVHNMFPTHDTFLPNVNVELIPGLDPA